MGDDNNGDKRPNLRAMFNKLSSGSGDASEQESVSAAKRVRQVVKTEKAPRKESSRSQTPRPEVSSQERDAEIADIKQKISNPVLRDFWCADKAGKFFFLRGKTKDKFYGVLEDELALLTFTYEWELGQLQTLGESILSNSSFLNRPKNAYAKDTTRSMLNDFLDNFEAAYLELDDVLTPENGKDLMKFLRKWLAVTDKPGFVIRMYNALHLFKESSAKIYSQFEQDHDEERLQEAGTLEYGRLLSRLTQISNDITKQYRVNPEDKAVAPPAPVSSQKPAPTHYLDVEEDEPSFAEADDVVLRPDVDLGEEPEVEKPEKKKPISAVETSAAQESETVPVAEQEALERPDMVRFKVFYDSLAIAPLKDLLLSELHKVNLDHLLNKVEEYKNTQELPEFPPKTWEYLWNLFAWAMHNRLNYFIYEHRGEDWIDLLIEGLMKSEGQEFNGFPESSDPSKLRSYMNLYRDLISAVSP